MALLHTIMHDGSCDNVVPCCSARLPIEASDCGVSVSVPHCWIVDWLMGFMVPGFKQNHCDCRCMSINGDKAWHSTG